MRLVFAAMIFLGLGGMVAGTVMAAVGAVVQLISWWGP